MIVARFLPGGQLLFLAMTNRAGPLGDRVLLFSDLTLPGTADWPRTVARRASLAQAVPYNQQNDRQQQSHQMINSGEQDADVTTGYVPKGMHWH
jgi:hypothetical protein